MARQLVRGDINLDLYAAAGTTPNIIGEAILGAGNAIGKALDDARKKADKVAKDDRTIEQIREDTVQNLEDSGIENQASDILNLAKPIKPELATLNPRPVTATTGNEVYSYSMLENDAKQTFLKNNPGATMAQAEAHAKNVVVEAKAYNVKKHGTKDPTGKVKGVNNVVNVTRTDDGEYVTGSAIGKPEIESSTTLGSSGVTRLKTTPLGRTRQTYNRRPSSQRSLATVYGGGSGSSGSTSQTSYLVGKRGVTSDVISRGQQSQFQEGRTFVEKKQRMSAPAWMGIGAAAAEGYNIGVDRENYDAQVSADLQDYYTQEFSGLVAGRTGNDIFDNSVKELLTNKKKEIVELLQQRQQYYAEGREGEFTVKYNNAKQVPNDILSLVEGIKGFNTRFDKDYEADNIDFEAMSTEMNDEVMTVRRGGSVLGVVDVENQTMVGGATRGGMPYLKSVKAMIADGKGPKYITKKNAFDYVNSVVDMIRKDPDKYSTTYQDANGVKVKRPMTFEELSPYLNRMYDAELDSNSAIRAYASPNNWDEDGMDAKAFDLNVKLSANGKSKSPENFVKEKFNEVAKDLLAPYFHTTETTRLASTVRGATGATGTTGNTDGQETKTTNPADYFATKVQPPATPSDPKLNLGLDNTALEPRLPKQTPSTPSREETFFASYPNIKQLGLAPNLQEPTVEDGELVIRSTSKTSTTLGKDGGTSARTSGGDILARIPITASPEQIATQLDLIIQSNKIAFPDNLPSTNFDAKQYINNYNQGK